MNRRLSISTFLLTLLFTLTATAQPPGITMEMISRTLPLEGAPLAVPGPYKVTREAAFDNDRYIVFRPVNLGAFPAQDKMPVMIWGNGGCAIDGRRYGDFLSTIASHGFLVMTSMPIKDEESRSGNASDMINAIEWAETENTRDGSHLKGKIDTRQIALMGQSCGGFMSAEAGLDLRVDTIGMFNSGLNAPSPNAQPGGRITSDSMSGLHGPVLLINGGEVDFMYEIAQANFDIINHVPVFYGARENAGHTATVFHPGGGEYANVASNWLKYILKNDAKAGEMFVGENCTLCTNPTWETESKGLN